MINFNFSEKGLRPVSPSYFMYDFSREVFLMLDSLNWPNFILRLLLLLETLGNMCITTVCWPGCDVIKLEINLSFLHMTKKSRQKLQYLENGKDFLGKIKSIFHHLQWAFSCQILSQAWECAFNSVWKV